MKAPDYDKFVIDWWHRPLIFGDPVVGIDPARLQYRAAGQGVPTPSPLPHNSPQSGSPALPNTKPVLNTPFGPRTPG